MKTNETPTEAVTRAARADAVIDEKLAWLETCHGPLDAHGLEVLDAVFPPFMRRHYDTVRWRALRWRVPEEEAKDVVQEVFIAFHARVRAHGVKSTLITTLQIVARGKLLQDARDRREALSTVGIPSSRSAPPESAVDVERAIDLRTLARKFLHELSGDHQAVVEKRILQNKTAVEVAEELHLAVGTVKTRLRAAIGQLRALTEPWLPKSQRDGR